MINTYIITLFYNSYNYGGVLQAIALNKILQNNPLVLKSQQLNYDNHNTNSNDSLLINNTRPKFIAKNYKSPTILVKKARTLAQTLLTEMLSIEDKFETRKARFDQFREQTTDNNVYTEEQLEKFAKTNSGVYIAGSDQIWNPEWDSKPYYLSFVPDSLPKIAYSASIGKNELSKEQLHDMIFYLDRMQYISVREEKAKEIIQPNIEKEIKVNLDPTLLLTKEEWDEIAVTPNINTPYIFVYLLGAKKRHRTIIKKIAKLLNYKIVFIPHAHMKFQKNDINFADKEIYNAGPAEFIGWIKNAELVITDSFHGCVFSTIYHKTFWALRRQKDSDPDSMNSRLYSLFKNLELGNRFIEDQKYISTSEIMQPIDYIKVDTKLEILRQDSIGWLQNAIEKSNTTADKK